jgi:hypothetical protein
MRTPQPDRAWRDALFLWLVVANLLPIFWFSRLPSADGPAHVYNASLFLRLADAGDPAWQFVEFNRSLPPNLLTHLVLALLSWMTGPALAERLLVAIYAVLLPLAFRYALRGIGRETHGIEFAGLFLVYNQHLHWGFYNFLGGLVAYLFAAGAWLRVRAGDFSMTTGAAMAGLAAIVYFCHPVPLMAFWLTLAFLFAVDAARTRTISRSELQLAAAAALPSLLLYVHYTWAKPPAPAVPWEWSTPRFAASVLVRLYPLATYTAVERLAALALSCGIAAAAVWAYRAGLMRASRPAYAVAAMMFAALVFLAPSQAAGGTLITPRLVYFPLLFALFWLASIPWPKRAATVFASVAIALTVAAHASRWPVYQRYQTRLNVFLNAAAAHGVRPVEMFYVVGHGTTVNLDSTSTPYLPAGVWGYVAADRRNVLLDYEPSLGYFPFAYRTNADPARFVQWMPAGCYMSSGGLIDAAKYREATGLTVASQIVWLYAGNPRDADCLRTYGRRITRKAEAGAGTLMWFDSEG